MKYPLTCIHFRKKIKQYVLKKHSKNISTLNVFEKKTFEFEIINNYETNNLTGIFKLHFQKKMYCRVCK